MANINKVGPGDLITAQLMNDLIEAIQTLQLQVQGLQGGTTGTGQKPVILATIPSGSITAGDSIQVIGQNFAPGNDIITFAGFTIDALDGSSNASKLGFTVPELTFNGPSKDVLITVRNNYGTATWPISLLPAKVVPHGQMAFSADPSVPLPATITSPNTYVFGFLANSQTNIPESYTFSLILTGVAGSVSLAAWTSSIKLLGPGNVPVGATPIKLQPFTDMKLSLSLTVPVGALLNDTVTVSVRGKSQNNDVEVSATSNPLVIKVGQTTVVSDDGIQFSNETHVAASGANPARKVTDQGIEYVELPYKKSGQNPSKCYVNLKAFFKVAGSASYKLEAPPAADWEIVTWGPQSTTATPQSGVPKAAGEDEVFAVILRLKREAPADASTHPEAAILKITATRVTGVNAPKDSFIPINIRGYAS